MIVNSFEDMKRYLPAAQVKMPAEFFLDALEVAQDSLKAEILGESLTALLEEGNKEDKQLLGLVRRAISLEAFLRSIPRLDLVITEAGFGVVSNQDIAPASRERIQALTESIRADLDDAKDRIVSFLLKSHVYSDWRGTEEFAALTDGLFMTFADFKEHAPFSIKVAEAWPHSWAEFRRLGGALNVALTSDVAAYISPEYADELLEKVRDSETLFPLERKVLKTVKTAVAAIALGDRDTGLAEAIKAAAFMKANIGEFPTFAASDAASDLSLQHDDSPIFSMIR
ncbi:MAG: hypothetical protein J6O51_00870 [Bacteroidales bacterium]|nr:hypothetical protein [Bacteroidales bacterium]